MGRKHRYLSASLLYGLLFVGGSVSSGCEGVSCPVGTVEKAGACREDTSPVASAAEATAGNGASSSMGSGGANPTIDAASRAGTASNAGAAASTPSTPMGGSSSADGGAQSGGENDPAAPASDAGPDAVNDALGGPCQSNPGAALCVGAEMYTCNPGGMADAVESCTSEMLCQVGLAYGKCATCNPGTFECSDLTLSECQDGVLVTIDTCASVALCNEAAGMCTEMLCQPGDTSCADNGDLQTCNADGSEFANTEPCGANMCDAVNGRCNVCAPNVVSCEGDAAVRCNPDGQGSTTQRCEAPNDCYTASCRSGACQNAPKRRGSECTQGVCDGTGSCVQCLEDADCQADEECNSNRQCVQKPCGDGRIDSSEACDPRNALYEGSPPSSAPSGACDPNSCQFTDKIYQYNCGTTPNSALWGDWVCNGVGAPSKYCTSPSECRTTAGKGDCITYGEPGNQIKLCGIPCSQGCPDGMSCQDLVGSGDTCGYSCAGPGCEGYVPPP